MHTRNISPARPVRRPTIDVIIKGLKTRGVALTPHTLDLTKSITLLAAIFDERDTNKIVNQITTRLASSRMAHSSN